MKIVIIGANGQLGSDVYRIFKDSGSKVVTLNHDSFEVSDLEMVTSVMRDIKPDLVFNTAAMHNVEACEEGPEKAFLVNGIGPMNLAQVSNKVGYTLIHVSTDYVFDGDKQTPYVESDCPNPLNVYGNTKLSGELFVRSISNKYFIIRVSALYGQNPCRAKGGLNFVDLMIKLAKERDEVRVVDDETVSPTYTEDVAGQVLELIQCSEYGVYHLTSQGSCSWYEFASKIFELTDIHVRLSKANSNEFPTKVNRPKYSVLENKALQSIQLDIMPHWTVCLKRYLQNKKEKF